VNAARLLGAALAGVSLAAVVLTGASADTDPSATQASVSSGSSATVAIPISLENTSVPQPEPATGPLAHTGANVRTTLLAGIALVLAGLFALLAARRRHGGAR
jgi:LPXTG-motif cell wall-anchored protein